MRARLHKLTRSTSFKIGRKTPSYSITFNELEDSTIETLLEALDGKVYFAGETMAAGNTTTVPGAGESAYTVVETILRN